MPRSMATICSSGTCCSAAAAGGFRDYEISLLAAAWIVPLLTRGVAGVTGVPLGLLVLLTFYVLALRRAVHHLVCAQQSAMRSK